MNGHHRRQPTVLHQRAADDGVDADRLKGLASLAGDEFAVDVAYDQGPTRAHVGRRPRPEQVEAVRSGRTLDPGRVVVVADPEAVEVAVDIRIGAA